MSLDGWKVLRCKLTISSLAYIEIAVNGKLRKLFLFHGFVLGKYVALWYENIFLKFVSLLLDSLFFANDL